jgi:predicted transposase YbfD/YdcC
MRCHSRRAFLPKGAAMDPSPRPRSLGECFAHLPDPRVTRTRAHKLIDILVIGLCSTLAGGEGFTDMEFLGRALEDWFGSFLELPHGIPSHDTFNRVFSALDPGSFLDCFVAWVEGVCTALHGQGVAIDGKALRRAAQAGAPLPYIVSAWATAQGLTLGQVKVDDKSNEITAIPELLRVLALKGCIVTIDAMGCQREIAAQLAAQGADYVLALKGNQETAHQEFQQYFDYAVPRGTTGLCPRRLVPADTMQFCETIEKRHGRREVRRYWQTCDIAWFHDRSHWKQLASAGVVESRRTVHGHCSVERRYYLSSLPLGVEAFAQAVRGHWGVENPLHWSLDVTFREDQSRARTRYAAQNLATLRRLALNLIRLDKTRTLPVRQKCLLAALNRDYLKHLLGI